MLKLRPFRISTHIMRTPKNERIIKSYRHTSDKALISNPTMNMSIILPVILIRSNMGTVRKLMKNRQKILKTRIYTSKSHLSIYTKLAMIQTWLISQNSQEFKPIKPIKTLADRVLGKNP